MKPKKKLSRSSPNNGNDIVNENVDLPNIEETNDKMLKEKLLQWYNEFRPTRKSVDGLLKVLKS